MLTRSLTLTLAVAGLQGGCASTEPRSDRSQTHGAETRSLLLADFDGDHPRVDRLSGEWRAVNDNIMGGRSLGDGEIQDGAMVFSGSTNTNGGGFSSVRAGDKQWDLGGFEGLAARVRGDGRRYVFHIQTGLRSDGSEVFYRGSFDTDRLIDAEGRGVSGDGAWREVFVRFGDFIPMIRGQNVSGRVEPLDPTAVRGIGLMIDDGLDGPFRLEVDWVKSVGAADETGR